MTTQSPPYNFKDSIRSDYWNKKRKKETFEYRKEVYVYQPITGATGNVWLFYQKLKMLLKHV